VGPDPRGKKKKKKGKNSSRIPFIASGKRKGKKKKEDREIIYRSRCSVDAEGGREDLGDAIKKIEEGNDREPLASRKNNGKKNNGVC